MVYISGAFGKDDRADLAGLLHDLLTQAAYMCVLSDTSCKTKNVSA